MIRIIFLVLFLQISNEGLSLLELPPLADNATTQTPGLTPPETTYIPFLNADNNEEPVFDTDVFLGVTQNNTEELVFTEEQDSDRSWVIIGNATDDNEVNDLNQDTNENDQTETDESSWVIIENTTNDTAVECSNDVTRYKDGRTYTNLQPVRPHQETITDNEIDWGRASTSAEPIEPVYPRTRRNTFLVIPHPTLAISRLSPNTIMRAQSPNIPESHWTVDDNEVLVPRGQIYIHFLYAAIYHILSRHEVVKNNRCNEVRHYVPYERELNMEGFAYPVTFEAIKKFEENNDISINVNGREIPKRVVVPLRISQQPRNELIQLFFHDGHYSLVRNLNRLLASSNLHKANSFFCDRCLQPKYSQQKLTEHRIRCKSDNPQRYIMPSGDDTTLRFKNHRRRLRAPLVLYCDFEAICEPMPGPSPDPSKSSTTRYNHQLPSSYGIYAVNCCCEPGEIQNAHEIYRGPNTSYRFLDSIINGALTHQERIGRKRKLYLTDDEQKQHNESQVCYLCLKNFNAEDSKDREHCHLCGRYRGAAHGVCNRQLQQSRDVTVVFHNLRGYDGHLIMQQIGAVSRKHGLEINVIPKGMEDYIGFKLTMRNRKRRRRGGQGGVAKRRRGTGANLFINDEASDDDEKGESPTTWNIRFIDSHEFFKNSMAELVEGLDKAKEFRHMRAHFPKDKVEMLLRKGVFPYDYVDAWDKYDDLQLPQHGDFFSKLSNANCSEEDYVYARSLFDAFNLQSLGEYNDLYLKCDVLQLADFFETFRDNALKNYGLDPVHYYTLQSYSWDAMLKCTAVELELVQDPDMYQFFEDGKRGGISMISKRKATANNEQAVSPQFPYDPSKPKTWLIYLDANNLYGLAMSGMMPKCDYRWMTAAELSTFDITTIDSEGDTGYILECDIDYPDHLHDLHNAYPLAPEKLTITDDMLSPYAKDLKELLNYCQER